MSTDSTPSTAKDTPMSAPHGLVKHTTTGAAPVHPFLDTTVPPINPEAPAELDSTPVSPVNRKESWKTRPAGTLLGPEETYEDFTGEGDANETLRQKRKELLAERSKNPGVLVDIPLTPGAEEYEIAQDVVGSSVATKSDVVGVTPVEVAKTVGGESVS